MVICMTNGGMYPEVKTIDGYDVSEMEAECIIKRLEKQNFIRITSGTGECILKTSCISSINL